MKKLAILLFLCFFASQCFADGFIVMPDYASNVFMPEQKAVVFWDGRSEQLVIESKVTLEEVESLAWLIPIESSTKPEVEAADEDVFFRLADLFRERPKNAGRTGIFGSMSAAGDVGVEVVEQLEVDIYDITILKATDETALIAWLNENGYSFQEAFPNLLSEYVSNGKIYFIANKIDLENKHPGLSPTSNDFECAQAISGDTRRFEFDSFEPERVESYMGYYDECDNADPEAVAALVPLRLGIATPLKITFTPDRPFYPMKLSSLNTGQGLARVYFVGKQPFKDNSGLLDVQNMVQVQSTYLSEYGINKGDFVTLLLWEDNYGKLDRDSYFSETAFNPELDPNYVPPLEVLSGFLFVFLLAMLAGLLLCVPMVIVPFLLGMALSWILEQKKKPKSFFAESNGLPALIAAAVIILAAPVLFLGLSLFPFLIEASNYALMLFFQTLTFLSAILTPYYASMACGFFFRKSNYKLRYLLGAAAVFFLLVFLLLILL